LRTATVLAMRAQQQEPEGDSQEAQTQDVRGLQNTGEQRRRSMTPPPAGTSGIPHARSRVPGCASWAITGDRSALPQHRAQITLAHGNSGRLGPNFLPSQANVRVNPRSGEERPESGGGYLSESRVRSLGRTERASSSILPDRFAYSPSFPFPHSPH
jgi:hypothetical protein